ncbi:neutral amino acid permease [Fusarium denticulatum]|uniref:Neutral amino acid permease n=1 Tax=Fusarium denticulatum TaxID=48507 RepID=A0A8H5TAG2_9HYPO|nr:neutral amino acid permease [Fusarium denticulatum]
MGIIHAKNRESGALDPVPVLSQEGPNQDDARPTVAHDEVFGDITEDGPNYRDVGWLGTSALMMKTQIGLGILSIPSAFHTLGLVPGLICLLVIGGITTWSDYIIGTFKLNHREVYGIDDAGGILFGRFGRELLGISFSLLAAIIVFLCASIRTLGRISWLAWVGVISLLAGVYVVTIAVSIQDRPEPAPKINLQHEWKSDYQLYEKPSFMEAMPALSTMVFAYAGTPLFFPIAAEMRDPRHYTKAMLLCQSVATATYIIVGVIIYYYCGSYVASPALGSAGKTIKQVAYGLALPGLIVGATINAHVTGKYVFVRVLRGSRHLTANTLTHWATWLGLTFSAALLAYIIASAIPVFGSLVSLVGALLGTLQTFQPYGCFWLYDNWSAGKQERSLKWILMVTWSSFVILSGMFLMIAGTYGSVIGVIDSYKVSGGSAAFSCADNSNSV